MKKRKTKNGQRISWVDSESLWNIQIKERGYIGGCILIPYVKTADGKMFLVKQK